MAGYTKLFSSLITSTVWREEKHVKVVWITMLALSDRSGVVEGSVPGLADMARVTREECEDALRILSSPDPDSRTKTMDGRRIVAIEDGRGWRLVNHDVYRARMADDERRERNAAYMREYRARNVLRKTYTLPVSEVEHAEADTDTDLVHTHPDLDPPRARDPSTTARSTAPAARVLVRESGYRMARVGTKTDQYLRVAEAYPRNDYPNEAATLFQEAAEEHFGGDEGALAEACLAALTGWQLADYRERPADKVPDLRAYLKGGGWAAKRRGQAEQNFGVPIR